MSAPFKGPLRVQVDERDGPIILDGEGYIIAESDNDEAASYLVRAANAHEGLVGACATFVEWLDREDAGPQYPEGTNRQSPGGEAIWREWWDGNVALCKRAQESARAALARAEGEGE